jgi:hypothetical protein
MVVDKDVCGKVVCDRWWLTKMGGVGGGGGGIQNQKQDPRTDMWGKIVKHVSKKHRKKVAGDK